MTSSRLPGKVLLPAAGKPMLYHLTERLKQVSVLDDIVLATTVNKTDDILVDFARDHDIRCFRGSEDNVMSRVLDAARSADADVIVEITADCPIIDPEVIAQTIELYRHNECEYASNVVVRSYPIGMDTQVFSTDVLARSQSMTDHPLDQEHVTRHIRQNPDKFRLIHLASTPSLHWPELALTLDEQHDYELLKSIIEYFAPAATSTFTCFDVIQLLRNEHPEWVGINADVGRKGLNA